MGPPGALDCDFAMKTYTLCTPITDGTNTWEKIYVVPFAWHQDNNPNTAWDKGDLYPGSFSAIPSREEICNTKREQGGKWNFVTKEIGGDPSAMGLTSTNPYCSLRLNDANFQLSTTHETCNPEACARL